MTRLFNEGPRGFQCGADYCIKVRSLLAEFEPVPGNSTEVEEVVDEAGEVDSLSMDDFLSELKILVIARLHLQNLRGRGNGSQGISQFMRQRGEELIFAAVRLLEPGCKGLQIGCALHHPRFEVRVQFLELPCLAIEVGEDADFRSEDLRDNGHRNIID